MAEIPGTDGTFGRESCGGAEITETPEIPGMCEIPESLSTTASGRPESPSTGRCRGRWAAGEGLGPLPADRLLLASL